MQIFTIEDEQFTQFLSAWKGATIVGRYWKNGEMQIVSVTSKFVLVSWGEGPQKIAIKPTRSIGEAQSCALQLLKKEKKRGNAMELETTFRN